MGLTAACGGGVEEQHMSNGSRAATAFNAAATSVVNPSDKKGGTLNLWIAAGRRLAGTRPICVLRLVVWNLNRLYSRKLVTYDVAPGKDGLKLVPDLAPAAPTVSADKQDLHVQAAERHEVRRRHADHAKDIKYGIERVCASGRHLRRPGLPARRARPGPEYKGPYKDKDPNKLGLKTVETPDDSTIIFHLRSRERGLPVRARHAGSALRFRRSGTPATSTRSSPRPPARTCSRASRPARARRWVRNPNWDPATDPIRKALPDKIDLHGHDQRRRHGQPPAGRHRGPGRQPDRRAGHGPHEDPERPDAEGERGRPEQRLPAVRRPRPDGRAAGQHRLPQGDHLRVRPDVAAGRSRWPVRGWRHRHQHAAAEHRRLGRRTTTRTTASQGKPQIDKAKQELQACGQPNGFAPRSRRGTTSRQEVPRPRRCRRRSRRRHHRDDRPVRRCAAGLGRRFAERTSRPRATA